jgi:hypothetical protein
VRFNFGTVARSVFLLQFVFSSIVICLVGFQLIILNDSEQTAVYIGVLVISMAETFLLCYHGQKLIDASTRVSDQINKSKWYSVKDLKVKKVLPMMMSISQEMNCLSGFGFVDICYEAFADVSLNILLP